MINIDMFKKLKNILSIISIHIFDNTLGFYMNIKYFIYNFSCRLFFKHKKNSFDRNLENKKLVAQLKKNGVVILGKEKKISKIKDKFLNYFEGTTKDNYFDNQQGYFFLKRNLSSQFTEELYEFIKLNLDNFLKEYYESNYNAFWTNIIRSYPIKNFKDNESLLYHFDDNPSGILKIFIYLNEQNENTGAFKTLLKSDSSSLKKKGFLSYTTDERLKNQTMITDSALKNKVNTFSGKEGTILIFENNIIHKGNLPKESYRDLIVIETMRSHNDFSKNNLETSLSKQITDDFPRNPFSFN